MIYHCKYDELVQPASLKDHPKNRNKHSKEQVERLAKIIAYQGWRYAIKVSKQSGFITTGHGRKLAAFFKGWDRVPVVYQDYTDTDQEYADVQADNAVASWAELDLAGINLDVPDLGPDFDIDLLGIKDFVVEPADKYGDQDADAVPEVRKTDIQLGDLFQLGNHRLLCGDATKREDVERLMNGEKADMVFTDPPYGYSYESNHQTKHSVLKNDDQILNFFPVIAVGLKDDSSAFVFGSHQTIHLWRPLFDKYWEYKNLIVWKKNNWSMGDLKGAFAGQHELILFGRNGRIDLIGERSRDVWEFDRDPPKDHPTQKPIALIQFALSKVPSSLVLDPFLGSGTTLIACEKTNRRCFGMEIDPQYCQVIIDRFEKFSGQKAAKL